MGKRLFSWLWGVCMVDTEDYPGTKVALRAYIVCAQLVLHYYRLVLLSLWTIEGFIAALCAECLHGFFFLLSSRSREIFSIKFLKKPCQDEEVWPFPSPTSHQLSKSTLSCCLRWKQSPNYSTAIAGSSTQTRRTVP